MTLILGMTKAEGLYLSADFRVTDSRSGKLINDTSAKLIEIHFPPVDTGTRAVFAYTGLAMLRDGTPMSRWLVETLRGEAEYPDALMAHLRTRLDRDVAPMRAGLIIVGLLVEGELGERRLAGTFTNLQPTSTGVLAVQPQFSYGMEEITRPWVFATGSGAITARDSKHLDVARRQLAVRPSKASDHMNLLASINRRVAAKNRSVSPACQVAFVPAKRPTPGVADNRFGPQTKTYTKLGESSPNEMPFIFAGIDIGFMSVELLKQTAAIADGQDPPPSLSVDEMNENLKRRP